MDTTLPIFFFEEEEKKTNTSQLELIPSVLQFFCSGLIHMQFTLTHWERFLCVIIFFQYKDKKTHFSEQRLKWVTNAFKEVFNLFLIHEIKVIGVQNIWCLSLDR